MGERLVKDLGASYGPGSHAEHEAAAHLRPVGFDPSRDGRLSREEIDLALAASWAVARPWIAADTGRDPGAWGDMPTLVQAVTAAEFVAGFQAVMRCRSAPAMEAPSGAETGTGSVGDDSAVVGDEAPRGKIQIGEKGNG